MQRQEDCCEVQLDEQNHLEVSIRVKPRFMNGIMPKNTSHSISHTESSNERSASSNNKKQSKSSKKKVQFNFKKLSLGTISEQGLEKKVVQINGNKIEGTWKNNVPHGHLVISYGTGQFFEGTYFNGNRIEGLVRFKDGTQYQGGFWKDLFHGNGSLKDPAGRVITCEWNLGQAAKKGKIEYPSGDIYVGQMQSFKKHGKGHLFFKNGSKYVGNFLDGTITGYGSYYQNDLLISQGNWKNGVLEVEETVRQILLSTLELDKFMINESINEINGQTKQSFLSYLV